MESYAPQKKIVNQLISNLFLILRIKSYTVFLFHSTKQSPGNPTGLPGPCYTYKSRFDFLM